MVPRNGRLPILRRRNMKLNHVHYLVNRSITALFIATIAYGAFELHGCGALMDKNDDAMVEALTIPFDLDHIRTLRAGDAGEIYPGQEPEEVNKMWRSIIGKIEKSGAFKGAKEANARLKSENPLIAFDEAAFIKGLSEAPGNAEQENQFKRTMKLVSFQAVSRESMASLVLRHQLIRGAALTIFGLFGLLMNAFLGTGRKNRLRFEVMSAVATDKPLAAA